MLAAASALSLRLASLASTCSSPGEALQVARALAVLAAPPLGLAAIAALVAVAFARC